VKDKGHAQNSRTMNKLENKKCCQGCKSGQPGQNESCKAKLLMEQLEKNKTRTTETDV
jgi:hypothetical protein